MNLNLSEKKCLSCLGEQAAFDKTTSQKYLQQINDWKISDDMKWIFKEFRFKNFADTLALVNRVGEIAEEEGHHPNIDFTWGKCKISIQTHKIDGLCESDFILAAKIDKII